MTKLPRKPTVAPPPPRPKVPRLPPPPAAGKKRASTKSRAEDKDEGGADGRAGGGAEGQGGARAEAKAAGRGDGKPAARPLMPARPRAVSEIEVELDLDGIELDEVEDEIEDDAEDDAVEEAAGAAAADASKVDAARPSGSRLDAPDGADAGGSVLDALDLPASQPIRVPDDQLVDPTGPRPAPRAAPAGAPPRDSPARVEAEAPAGPPALSIAVHEDPSALATLEGVIEAAGHAIAIGASGKDGLRHVRQALAGYVDALIVGLPGGAPLIDAALALAPSRPVVIAAVDGPAIDGIRRAAAAGADLALVRPHDADRLAPVLLAAARLVDEQRRAATARSAEQLLRARLDALAEPETGSLQPYELFHRVLEIELKRARRYSYPISVALFALELPPPAPPPFVRGILRARAGTTLVQTIRDIDLATSLPLDVSRSFDSIPASDERFLVLLPYTDLAGAAMLARRVIAVVAEGAPVVAAGRTFPPRVIGAVAGAAPGQPLAFSRLMKEATRALEQARHDGAELAVPMPISRGGK